MTSSNSHHQQISPEISEDDSSQIRGLEEEKGIFHNEEVDVPPKYESDEDSKDYSNLRGVGIPSPRREDPSPRHEDLFNRSIDDMPRPQTTRKMSLKVRFTGDEEEEMQQLARYSPDRLEMIKNLENPTEARNMDPEDSFAFRNVVDHESTTGKPAAQFYPPGSPPAYSSSVEPPSTPAAEHPRRPQTEPIEGTAKDKVTDAKPTPNSANKTRGSLNELIMSKVTQPFQKLLTRSKEESDSEEENYLDHGLNEEEAEVLRLLVKFTPEHIELQSVLHPFLLDYIPSIGDIDAFIKIPRPDEVEDNTGLTHLDEPAVKQSDPTILDMQLRNATNAVTTQEDAPVKRLDRADRNSDQIASWIENIKELHRSRPAQTVHYKGAMPDVEKLMQEWNPQFEQALKGLQLPTAELDCTLEEYVDLVLNLVDIPVGKSRIHSLHLLFSLYAEFKNSAHFRNLAQSNNREQYEDTMDRLEL